MKIITTIFCKDIAVIINGNIVYNEDTYSSLDEFLNYYYDTLSMNKRIVNKVKSQYTKQSCDESILANITHENRLVRRAIALYGSMEQKLLLVNDKEYIVNKALVESGDYKIFDRVVELTHEASPFLCLEYIVEHGSDEHKEVLYNLFTDNSTRLFGGSALLAEHGTTDIKHKLLKLAMKTIEQAADKVIILRTEYLLYKIVKYGSDDIISEILGYPQTPYGVLAYIAEKGTTKHLDILINHHDPRVRVNVVIYGSEAHREHLSNDNDDIVRNAILMHGSNVQRTRAARINIYTPK